MAREMFSQEERSWLLAPEFKSLDEIVEFAKTNKGLLGTPEEAIRLMEEIKIIGEKGDRDKFIRGNVSDSAVNRLIPLADKWHQEHASEPGDEGVGDSSNNSAEANDLDSLRTLDDFAKYVKKNGTADKLGVLRQVEVAQSISDKTVRDEFIRSHIFPVIGPELGNKLISIVDEWHEKLVSEREAQPDISERLAKITTWDELHKFMIDTGGWDTPTLNRVNHIHYYAAHDPQRAREILALLPDDLKLKVAELAEPEMVAAESTAEAKAASGVAENPAVLEPPKTTVEASATEAFDWHKELGDFEIAHGNEAYGRAVQRLVDTGQLDYFEPAKGLTELITTSNFDPDEFRRILGETEIEPVVGGNGEDELGLSGKPGSDVSGAALTSEELERPTVKMKKGVVTDTAVLEEALKENRERAEVKDVETFSEYESLRESNSGIFAPDVEFGRSQYVGLQKAHRKEMEAYKNKEQRQVIADACVYLRASDLTEEERRSKFIDHIRSAKREVNPDLMFSQNLAKIKIPNPEFYYELEKAKLEYENAKKVESMRLLYEKKQGLITEGKSGDELEQALKHFRVTEVYKAFLDEKEREMEALAEPVKFERAKRIAMKMAQFSKDYKWQRMAAMAVVFGLVGSTGGIAPAAAAIGFRFGRGIISMLGAEHAGKFTKKLLDKVRLGKFEKEGEEIRAEFLISELKNVDWKYKDLLKRKGKAEVQNAIAQSAVAILAGAGISFGSTFGVSKVSHTFGGVEQSGVKGAATPEPTPTSGQTLESNISKDIAERFKSHLPEEKVSRPVMPQIPVTPKSEPGLAEPAPDLGGLENGMHRIESTQKPTLTSEPSPKGSVQPEITPRPAGKGVGASEVAKASLQPETTPKPKAGGHAVGKVTESPPAKTTEVTSAKGAAGKVVNAGIGARANVAEMDEAKIVKDLSIGKRGPEGTIIDYLKGNPEDAKRLGWDGTGDLKKWAGVKAHELWRHDAEIQIKDPAVQHLLEENGYEKSVAGYGEMMTRIKHGKVSLEINGSKSALHFNEEATDYAPKIGVSDQALKDFRARGVSEATEVDTGQSTESQTEQALADGTLPEAQPNGAGAVKEATPSASESTITPEPGLENASSSTGATGIQAEQLQNPFMPKDIDNFRIRTEVAAKFNGIFAKDNFWTKGSDVSRTARNVIEEVQKGRLAPKDVVDFYISEIGPNNISVPRANAMMESLQDLKDYSRWSFFSGKGTFAKEYLEKYLTEIREIEIQKQTAALNLRSGQLRTVLEGRVLPQQAGQTSADVVGKLPDFKGPSVEDIKPGDFEMAQPSSSVFNQLSSIVNRNGSISEKADAVIQLVKGGEITYADFVKYYADQTKMENIPISFAETARNSFEALANGGPGQVTGKRFLETLLSRIKEYDSGELRR